jgi:hypothetical protein
MSTAYQRIENDLLENVQNIRTVPRPYKERDKSSIKQQKWKNEMRRAKYQNSLTTMKVLYYYLGETLENDELKRKFSEHERKAAKRIHRIHEPIGVEYLNGSATIADYRAIKISQLEALRGIALDVLSEREPLVGENLLNGNLTLEGNTRDWNQMTNLVDDLILEYTENITTEVDRVEDLSHDMGVTQDMVDMTDMPDMSDMADMPDMTDMPDMSDILDIPDM